MPDLAPVRLGSPRSLSWERAGIPGTERQGRALHVKCVDAQAASLASALGLPATGRLARIGSIEALGLGPSEWLLFAPAKCEGEFEAYEERVSAEGGVLAQAGDCLIILELNITRERLVSLSGLSAEALGPGCATRTRLADLSVIIASGPAQSFRLIFDRSHAQHLRAWLDRAD